MIRITLRSDRAQTLTASPARAKRNNQNLDRHVEEHPQLRNGGLELAPNVVGCTFFGDPVVDSIMEEVDRLGGFLMLAKRSSVDLFEDKMSSWFYQRAYPSQRIPEAG